jgi:hypothetical protein
VQKIFRLSQVQPARRCIKASRPCGLAERLDLRKSRSHDQKSLIKKSKYPR